MYKIRGISCPLIPQNSVPLWINLWKLWKTVEPYSIQKYRFNVHNLFTIYLLTNLPKYVTIYVNTTVRQSSTPLTIIT